MSGDRYSYEIPAFDVTFTADRLRRDHHDLLGELIVKCGLPGAQTVNGFLSTGDFNFSSVRTRQDRAKFLAERAHTNGKLDWFGLLEDFCQRVFEQERTGNPDVDLRTLDRPSADDVFIEGGLVLPRRHPTILFGDGGSAKSYMLLYLAGRLAQRGLRVGFADWELCGEDHRDRLERIFGSNMPEIRYQRCERPLTAEVDRLRRWQRDRQLDYIAYDSIAVACDGPPEAAEVASRYFRGVREIGGGSLHAAHITKATESSDAKPFGSTFWHNLARSTWFVQAAEQAGDGTLRLGFFNRKSNLGPLKPPASYVLTFTKTTTTFTRVDVADTPEFATKLTIRQRLDALLSHGAMKVNDVAAELEVEPNSIYHAINRHKNRFILLDGGRVGLQT